MTDVRRHVYLQATDVPRVARIVIDRAAEANAFTLAMCAEFGQALTAAEKNDDITVIVVDAEGPDVTAGLDPAEVGGYHENVPGVPEDRVPSLRARLRAAGDHFWGRDGIYARILGCTKVTVLGAKGRCHDVGLNLALFCDIVVAAQDAVFANPRWQHVGVDGDVSMLLATVGRKRANELMFAGAEWSADQALAAGLVNQVVPKGGSTEGAMDVARTVSTIMRDGIAAEKYLTLASTEKMGIGAGFATAAMMTAMSSTIHFREGEFNFLRERKNRGLEAAIERAVAAKSLR
ncbi:MAG TPA: enoyl-CoA hydratase/isomerase family protein [Amycolatopsis sp.]|nr:enoyl-CoA hydratase/isomerase family protein [Amycolatopsis sp.]